MQYKQAALTTTAWRHLEKAIERKRDLMDTMVDIGRHFKVPHSDAKFLYEKMVEKYPNVDVEFIAKDGLKTPTYYPHLRKIETYEDPWAFMHEFQHAGQQASIVDKLTRALPVKSRISKVEPEIREYINTAYMSGDNNSRNVGNLLHEILDDLPNTKEIDTWRLKEELLANARAYKQTAELTHAGNAEKILQPLSVSDTSYAGSFYPEKLKEVVQESKITKEPFSPINVIGNYLRKIHLGM